jgi:predicted Zn finger-like uncharacterized protein
MRLVCPNCNAQYEVPVDVIPDAGREVQCSNCGHLWFQPHPDFPVADSVEEAPEHNESEDAFGFHGAPAAYGGYDDDGLEDETADAGDFDADAPDEAEPEPERDAPPAPPRRRRQLDPEVADVLRAEAEREARARAAENQSLESQPDLGLEDQPKTRPAKPDPIPEPEAPDVYEDEDDEEFEYEAEVEEDEEIEAVQTSGKRRGELLPDIEELNSTLRTATEQRELERDQAEEDFLERRDYAAGFASGARVALLAVAILVLLYILSPIIIGFVPQAEPFLSPFISLIDEMRVWLESQFQALLGVLDGYSSETA